MVHPPCPSMFIEFSFAKPCVFGFFGFNFLFIPCPMVDPFSDQVKPQAIQCSNGQRLAPQRLPCAGATGADGAVDRHRTDASGAPVQQGSEEGEPSPEALVQSQVRFNRVPEKVSVKVLVQSQVRFNGICSHLSQGNSAEVFPALGFAARFRKICKNKTLRLLGIPPKLLLYYSPAAKLCYGFFGPDEFRCDPVQLRQGSGRFWCRYMQIPREIPEGSRADTS